MGRSVDYPQCVATRDVKLGFFIFDNRFVIMIGFTTPAGRSCVTVEKTHAVDCAPVVPTPQGLAATQWASRNCVSVWPAAGPPAKMRVTLRSRSQAAAVR